MLKGHCASVPFNKSLLPPGSVHQGRTGELVLPGGLIRVWSPGGGLIREYEALGVSEESLEPWRSQKRVWSLGGLRREWSLSRVFRAGYLICAAQFQMKKSEFQIIQNFSRALIYLWVPLCAVVWMVMRHTLLKLALTELSIIDRTADVWSLSHLSFQGETIRPCHCCFYNQGKKSARNDVWEDVASCVPFCTLLWGSFYC